MKCIRGMFLAACCLVLAAGCAAKSKTGPLAGFSTACVVISTPDPEALGRWYVRVLGFEGDGAGPGVTGVSLQRFTRGAVVLVLAKVPGQEPLAAPRDPPSHLKTPGLRNIVFWVDDLAAANVFLEAQGVTLLLKNIPVAGLGVMTTSFRDPDGNLVALWQKR